MKIYKNMDIVSKASIAYIIVGFLQRGISIISGPIFTRILSQEAYGMFSVYNTWFDIIGVVAMLSLSAGVYNNGLLEFKEDRNTFTFSLLILSNCVTLLMALVMVILREKLVELISLPYRLLVVMIICYLFSPALFFWTTRQRYEYKYRLSSFVITISTLLAVGISIVFTWQSTDSQKLVNKIWSEKIVLLIFWGTAYWYIAKAAKFRVNVIYWKYALNFNLPLIPHYLSNNILSSMDRMMIASLVNSGSAAIYSVAYSAAFLTSIFWNSVNSAILPMIYESIKSHEEGNIQKKTMPFIILYGLLCICISFIAPEIMSILAPESYEEGIYLIPVLLMGVFLTGIYCLFANVEFYYKSTKFIAFNSMISAALNIIFNFIFIKKFGYMAAAYTTVVCYGVNTLLHYVNYRRLISQKIYDEGLIFVIIVLVFVGCLICIPLYSNTVIRYVIFITILLIMIIKKDNIINVIRNIKVS